MSSAPSAVSLSSGGSSRLGLLNLQNLLKRDPAGYWNEYSSQVLHFRQQLKLAHLQSLSPHAAKDFSSLCLFLAHSTPLFISTHPELREIPQSFIDFLSSSAAETLDIPIRRSLVQSLILLQNRGAVSRLAVFPCLFDLFRIADKSLRLLVFGQICQDIRRANKVKKNAKSINSPIQTFLFQQLRSDNSVLARKAVEILIELWRRKVWIDEKVANSIAQAVFHKDVKIQVQALRFLLGLPFYDELEPESDSEAGDTGDRAVDNGKKQRKQLIMKGLKMSREGMKGVVKKRKKRERMIDRALRKLKKEENGKGGKAEFEHSSIVAATPAIQLIFDPQTFCERLFSALRSSSSAFQVRLLQMNVISRLIGAHRLMMINYYPFLQRFIQPHQRHVTAILTYVAQASHPAVPPDVLQPLIRTLANNFINDRSSPEVQAVGLNATREICARAPHIMHRELILDLAQYKSSKNKGVMMAARSLIALFRDKNPGILAKKDRGRDAQMALAAGEVADEDDYGVENVATDVFGADLLAKYDKQTQDEEKEWEIKTEQDDEEDDQDSEADEEDVEAVEEFLKQMQNDADGGDNDNEEEEEEMEENEEEEDDEADEAEDDEELEEGVEEEEDEEDEDEDGDDDEDEADNDGESGAAEAGSSSAAAASSAPSLPFAATRIFTPRDFELLRELRAKELLEAEMKHKKKRKAEDPEALEAAKKRVKHMIGPGQDAGDPASLTVDPESLIGWRAKKRKSKEERLESIKEGREGRAKFGAGKEKGGGTTNKEKLKLKPFMLVKHSGSIKDKKRRTFSESQQNAQKHIKALKNQGKKGRKKIRQKRGY